MIASFLTTICIDSSTSSSSNPVTAQAASNDGTASNYLTITNPATMRITKNDTFIFGGWFKSAVGVTDSEIFGKGPATTALSYFLDYNINTPGKFSLDVQKDDANNDDLITNTTTVSTGTKTFIVGWVDGTHVKLAINAGTAASAAHTPTNNNDGGGDVFLFSDGFNGYNGVLDNWFFCKNPADIAAAITLINSTVYNGGTGIQYSALSASDKTTMGLVSWWGLDESSGSTRLDSHGTNNLTLVGTITQVSPLVS